jgi:small subunit ribosomal protein S4
MLSNVLLSNASQVYEWITWNNDVKEGTFVSSSQISNLENIKEQLIVELYNK